MRECAGRRRVRWPRVESRRDAGQRWPKRAENLRLLLFAPGRPLPLRPVARVARSRAVEPLPLGRSGSAPAASRAPTPGRRASGPRYGARSRRSSRAGPVHDRAVPARPQYRWLQSPARTCRKLGSRGLRHANLGRGARRRETQIRARRTSRRPRTTVSRIRPTAEAQEGEDHQAGDQDRGREARHQAGLEIGDASGMARTTASAARKGRSCRRRGPGRSIRKRWRMVRMIRQPSR